ncbi:hypothetical protein C8F04DRAFT_1273794 [Mycena alexandri]|uniref:Uncharacterized protein n=1 Tax=Mycena alexandri TaxID=1745969 RepID=A0AAD6S535_9AGAR|nr:hypothetical protein C8F04DRAFT_1273794 [Mycena alexandri]
MGHEDLVDAVQTVEGIIDHLPLPSASDSPRTKSTWEKLLHLCHGVSLEITMHHTDMLAIMADEVDEEENEKEEEDPQQAGSQVGSQAGSQVGSQAGSQAELQQAGSQEEERAQVLIGGITEGRVSPSELFERISHPNLSLKAPQQEDLALGWILRGFEDGVWSRLVGKQKTNAAPSTVSFLQLSATLDTTPDLDRRDLNLNNSIGNSEGSRYLLEVIYKIETIKCAKEWLTHIGPGSGNYKQQFNTRFKKMKEFKEEFKEFKEFKKGREELITARNRLVSYWDYMTQFGTGVLIHTFFIAPNLGDKRGKTFRSLLKALSRLAPPAEEVQGAGRTRFHDVEERNRSVLHGLLKALCGDDAERREVKKYINNFYAVWPSQIIP